MKFSLGLFGHNKIIFFLLILGLGCAVFLGGFNFRKTNQVTAAANCPDGFVAVGDFCISRQSSGSGEWSEAVEQCASEAGGNARLCTASELREGCGSVTGSFGGSWIDDFTQAPYEAPGEGGGDPGEPSGETRAVFLVDCDRFESFLAEEERSFYCCRNL